MSYTIVLIINQLNQLYKELYDSFDCRYLQLFPLLSRVTGQYFRLSPGEWRHPYQRNAKVPGDIDYRPLTRKAT